MTTIAEDGASPGHDLTIVSCLTAVDTQAVDGIVKYDCLDWTKKAYCREGQTSTSSTTSSSRLNLTSSIPSSTTQSTASKANNSNATPSSTGSPSHAGGTSPGTVAGIVIASVIVTLGLISFALFSLRNRRRKQKYMALAAPIELPVPISGWGARGRNSIQRVGTGGALEMEVGNPVHVEESAYTDVSGSQAGQPSRS